MDDLGFRLMENARGALRILALCVMIGGVLALAAFCSACSSGPQLPIAATPLNINVTYNGMDGGTIEDCDVYIDRSATSAQDTTGNNIRDNTISPQVRANVSAIP